MQKHEFQDALTLLHKVALFWRTGDPLSVYESGYAKVVGFATVSAIWIISYWDLAKVRPGEAGYYTSQLMLSPQGRQQLVLDIQMQALVYGGGRPTNLDILLYDD